MTKEIIDEHTEENTYVAGMALDGEQSAQTSAEEYVSDENKIWCMPHRLNLVTRAVAKVTDLLLFSCIASSSSSSSSRYSHL